LLKQKQQAPIFTLFEKRKSNNDGICETGNSNIGNRYSDIENLETQVKYLDLRPLVTFLLMEHISYNFAQDIVFEDLRKKKIPNNDKRSFSGLILIPKKPKIIWLHLVWMVGKVAISNVHSISNILLNEVVVIKFVFH
ncbi:hypothetical protein ACJX0J_021236, partial [Zea mays]